jgi:hypothetical protein
MNVSINDTVNYLVPATGNTHSVTISGVASPTPYVMDWQGFSQQNFKFLPQGCFADNTQGLSDLLITIQPIGYIVKVAAGTAGQFQFPAPNNQTCSIVGNGQAVITFVDFPVLPNSGEVNIAGVPNFNLESSTPGFVLPTQPQINVSGSPYQVTNVPNTVVPEYLTILGASVSASVTPPPNSNLRKLIFSFTDDSSLAAAGHELLTITLNGVQIYKGNIYIPAAGGAQLYGYYVPLDFSQASPNTGAAGTLVATISTPLATGIFDLNAYFD